MNPTMPSPATKATELLELPLPSEKKCPNTVPWMLWWIIGVHYSFGLGLIFDRKSLESLGALIGVRWITDVGISNLDLGIFLIVVSTMAATGLILEYHFHDKPPKHVLILIGGLICPQYFVVLAAFLSDANILIDGEYNGNHIGRWLLLGALAPVLWGALLHTAAILERYATNWKQ